MAKLIAVSEDTYYKLEKLKKGKSFTSVINELLEKNNADISEFFGILKMSDKEADEFQRRVKTSRKDFLKKGL